MIDECVDCRRGRGAFETVIAFLRESEKPIAEWEAARDADSNCGNPKCPNKLFAMRTSTGGFDDLFAEH